MDISDRIFFLCVAHTHTHTHFLKVGLGLPWWGIPIISAFPGIAERKELQVEASLAV